MSGRGTSGGVVFQSEVGAYVAALLLTERPISRLGDNLPGTPLKLYMESPSAVDDVNVVTDKGQLYFQAKTTISLSTLADSELASVIDQFVRQYRAGVPVGTQTRAMDVRTDRLILAVGGSAAATVRTDLRIVLIKNRTGAATSIPKKEQDALKTITTQIKNIWNKIVGSVIPTADLQAILKLCTVVVLDDSQKLLATEALREVVATNGDETPLFNELVLWAADAATLGTGGDKSVIRLYLQGKITLKEPPSFAADVQRLTAHSKIVLQRLQRFTLISTDSGDITFTRTVTNIAVEAAKVGHLAITGDPGAGKSAIMHELSVELAKDAFVVTLTVESNLLTMDALQRQLGLEHTLTEVCRNISVTGKAFLVLDALDATRGGASEFTYRQLINDVAAITNWHVVASIRTFDLKLGLEWKKLFRGHIPDPNFSDAQFQTVRHVHVPLLGEEEFNQIEAQSPSLKLALASGGEKMVALAKNPFNLSLIGELLISGTAPTSLVTVGSRSELLSRYWSERVEVLGLQATIALKTFSELVISARAVDIPETEIPQGSSEYVERLHVNGVLITEKTRRVAFRHHILLDYAISRVLLEPDQSKAILLLSKTSEVGLLVSPSLEYWNEHLKRTLSTVQYWGLLASTIASNDTDPIIRVELSRLMVAGILPGEDLSSLAKVLSNGNGKEAIRHLANTLNTFGILSGQADDWALMISRITNISENYQLGSLRLITDLLLEQPLTSIGLYALGKVSRGIFDKISEDDELIHWLSAGVIDSLVKTYESDPEGTKLRLDKIFVSERFNKHGYNEIPALARNVVALVKQNEDFVATLYRKAFAGGNFSSEQQTGLGPTSWILSLRSNAAQDFRMAEYALGTDFAKILAHSPIGAIRAFAAAVDGKKKRWGESPVRLLLVPFDNGFGSFREDNSVYERMDDEHEALSKIYSSLMKWLEQVDSEGLMQFPKLVLAETGKAIAWKVLFIVGGKRPDVIGKLMWNSALDMNILSSLSTQQAAIDLIAATYPHMSEQQKQQAETTVLAHNFAHIRDPESFYRDTVSKLFNRIGRGNLVSQEALEFLDRASTEQIPIPSEVQINSEEDFGSSAVQGGGQNNDVTDEISISPHDPVDHFTDEPDLFEEGSWSDFNDGDDNSNIEDPSKNYEESGATITNLELIVQLINASATSEDRKKAAIQRLLSLTISQVPDTYEDIEAQFERSSVWSTGIARINAVEQMGELFSVPGVWPEVSSRYEQLLLKDPHPVIRMQASLHLTNLWDVDREAMWDLAGKFVEKEKNKAVLGYGAIELSTLRSCGAEKLEPLILKLSEKKPSSHGQTAMSATIIYLAFVKTLPGSQALLSKWITEFDNYKEDLNGVLFSLRGYYALGYSQGHDREARIRNRVVAFLSELVQKLKPILISWPTDREATERENDALRLYDEIGTQLYYAVGYVPSTFKNTAEQQAFLDEYGPIISTLNTLGTPNTVHHCLQVLEKLVEGNPEQCFDLISEAMLRTTGVAKYEHERMGAELFVKLVGIYMADYRSIFADRIRKNQLVECLAVFVEAGWPQARSLFQTLQELR